MESGELRHRMTLKEKLRNHYETHPPNFKPDPKQASKYGMTYFGVMLVTLLIEAMFILIPTLYAGDLYSTVFFEILAIFLFVEATMNWYKTWYDVANYVRKTTKEKYFEGEETPPGWRHCFTCQLDAPPRSYHCKVCNRCMLKRDHHCFFTSSCIGHNNQKYFIVLGFYTIAGCSVALFLQLSYFDQIFPISSGAVVHYIPFMAVFDWFTGGISSWQFVLYIHMCLTLICGVICAMFMTWQMLLIVCGKTGFEAKRRIHTYNLGTLDNLRSVFGPLKFCAVLFLVPLALPQCQDGIKWQNNKKRQKGH